MLTTLAISNYRTLREIVLPLGRLNLVTGANGSGKSNLYKALRLLAQTAQGGVVNALAQEGGLDAVRLGLQCCGAEVVGAWIDVHKHRFDAVPHQGVGRRDKRVRGGDHLARDAKRLQGRDQGSRRLLHRPRLPAGWFDQWIDR